MSNKWNNELNSHLKMLFDELDDSNINCYPQEKFGHMSRDVSGIRRSIYGRLVLKE